MAQHNTNLPVVYIRPGQAERMYNLSRTTINRMMAKHPDDPEYLPSVKVGTARLIKCADIEALLARLAR